MTVPRQTVVYATDARFWVHTFVSIYSLVVNSRDVPLDVIILSADHNPDFESLRDFLLRDHPNLDLEWRVVDDSALAHAPESGYLTRATYYRLLIGSILPDSVSRVTYLDGDTIIRRGLGELFDTDIDDWVVAVVPGYDPSDPKDRLENEARRLGWRPGTPFFNAGIMVINLDRWRDLRIEEGCLDYIRSNLATPSKLRNADNDALNVTLEGLWRSLNYTFNYTEWNTPDQLFEHQRPVDRELGPAIAHFAGPRKPWHGGSNHPFSSDYWHFRMRTPFADRRLYTRCKAVGAVRTLPRLARRVPGGESIMQAARAFLLGG